MYCELKYTIIKSINIMVSAVYGGLAETDEIYIILPYLLYEQFIFVTII